MPIRGNASSNYRTRAVHRTVVTIDGAQTTPRPSRVNGCTVRAHPLFPTLPSNHPRSSSNFSDPHFLASSSRRPSSCLRGSCATNPHRGTLKPSSRGVINALRAPNRQAHHGRRRQACCSSPTHGPPVSSSPSSRLLLGPRLRRPAPRLPFGDRLMHRLSRTVPVTTDHPVWRQAFEIQGKKQLRAAVTTV